MLQPQNINYFADLPVRVVEDDKFDRWQFANRVAQTIATRSDTSNLVIGIYGAWGEGKTSMLHFIDKGLERYKDIILTFWYNPWQFSLDSYKLLENFILILEQQLDLAVRDELRERIGQWAKKYGKLTASFFGKSDFADQLSDTFEPTLNLAELKIEFERILTEANKYVVVFMDDIDRLDRREIQLLFKMIKLSADFQRVVYVLAFDEEMVAAALGEQYGYGDPEAGRDFLEKIVQVPLQLPKADNASIRLFFYNQLTLVFEDLYVELTQTQQRELWEQLTRSIEPRLKTPRMIHRYCNALRFAIPILQGEVNLVDQLLIEGIRICYPNLYNMIRNDPFVFLQYSEEGGSPFYVYDRDGNHSKAVYSQMIEGLSSEEVEAINRILGFLFPAFARRILNHHVVNENNQDKEQRVSSRYYFHRYFSYAVTASDIADAKVNDLFVNLSLSRQQEVDDLLNTLSPTVADTFLRKVEVRIPETSPLLASKIAVALSKAGQLFSTDKKRSIFSSLRFEALRLIYMLVNKVDPIQRVEVVDNIIRESSPIDFAVDIAQWLLGAKDNKEEQLLPDQERTILERCISNRLDTYFTSHGLSDYGSSLQELFITWSEWGGRDITNHCIQLQLHKTPQFALDLIFHFYHEAWLENIGRPISLNDARKFYDRLVSVVDESCIYRSIHKLEDKIDFRSSRISDVTHLRRFSIDQQTAHNAALFNEEYTSRRITPSTIDREAKSSVS